MSRKTFIESVGATCKNWQWSWSFINSNEGFIAFGAWDRNTEGTKTLIFSEEWQSSAPDGRKPPGYSQSREHIRLIENENYKLMTVFRTVTTVYQYAHASSNACIGKRSHRNTTGVSG